MKQSLQNTLTAPNTQLMFNTIGYFTSLAYSSGRLLDKLQDGSLSLLEMLDRAILNSKEDT